MIGSIDKATDSIWSALKGYAGIIVSAMKRLLADPAAIDAVLADGAARAQKMARETMNAVKDVVGFVRS